MPRAKSKPPAAAQGGITISGCHFVGVSKPAVADMLAAVVAVARAAEANAAAIQRIADGLVVKYDGPMLRIGQDWSPPNTVGVATSGGGG